jgi:hypothetical protein
VKVSVDTFFIKNYNENTSIILLLSEIWIELRCCLQAKLGNRGYKEVGLIFFVTTFSITNISIAPLIIQDLVISPYHYQWRYSAMLWVEISLRRESSIVWCEAGLDALYFKVLTYMVFQEKDYTAKNFNDYGLH